MRRTEGAAALALLDRELIDADSPSPLYFQLYTVLHDAIVRGVLPNGSRMPSEKELSDGFDVSRITARRTLVELAAKGLVVRHRGKGTFVSHADRPAPIVAPLGSNAESLGDLGRDTSSPCSSSAWQCRRRTCRRLSASCGRPRVPTGARAQLEWPAVRALRLVDAEVLGVDAEERTRRREPPDPVRTLRTQDRPHGALPERRRRFARRRPRARRTERQAAAQARPFSYDAQGQLQDHLVARYNSDLFSYRVETKVGLD